MKLLLVQIITSVALLCGTVQSIEHYGTSEFPREPQVPASKFSYTGLTGPLNWYGLNETANVLCDKGKNQSPIDIVRSNMSFLDSGSKVSMTIPPYPEGAEFENLGTNVEVVVNGTLVYMNKTYALAQYHFHTPSEHRIDDEFFPMEAHFVFQSTDLQIAVVGFLVDFGPTNPLLAETFSSITAIPMPGNATLTGPLYFDSLQYHLRTHQIYRYSGSLTTPPCSESVNWIISAQPIYIDVGTFQKVKKVTKFNSRFTQDGLGMVNLLQNAANELNA